MLSFLFTPVFYISITIPSNKIICFAIGLIEFPLKYKYQFQQNPFIIITSIFLVSIRNFDIFLHYFILNPGYGNRIRAKYTAKWGVQIAGMIFQTRSSVFISQADIRNCIRRLT